MNDDARIMKALAPAVAGYKADRDRLAARVAELNEALDLATDINNDRVQQIEDLAALVATLTGALRYMADYEMTGTEKTLHIDFQGKARAALEAANQETR